MKISSYFYKQLLFIIAFKSKVIRLYYTVKNGDQTKVVTYSTRVYYFLFLFYITQSKTVNKTFGVLICYFFFFNTLELDRNFLKI